MASAASRVRLIPPGETIGILGGGQLGRMLAMAAAQLGYRCHIYAPEVDAVAAEVCSAFTNAAWDDAAALARFATDCAVITYEFENVPTGALAALGAVPLHPGCNALATAQDRLSETDRTLIGIALDACFTGLNPDALRERIRRAIALGIDTRAILQTLQMTAHLGVHACALGVPALMKIVDEG